MTNLTREACWLLAGVKMPKCLLQMNLARRGLFPLPTAFLENAEVLTYHSFLRWNFPLGEI
jgi:hypothetical protein